MEVTLADERPLGYFQQLCLCLRRGLAPGHLWGQRPGCGGQSKLQLLRFRSQQRSQQLVDSPQHTITSETWTEHLLVHSWDMKIRGRSCEAPRDL